LRRWRCDPDILGRWRYSPPPFAAFLGFAAAGLLLSLVAQFSPAAAVEYAKPVSNRLNTTGRAITMPLPLKSDGVAAGDVFARIEPDDSVSVSKADLSQRLTSIVGDNVQQILAAADADAGFVRLDVLKASGIDVTFDPGLQEIEFHLSADQHQDGEIRLSKFSVGQISGNLTPPAAISGYTNFMGGLDTLWPTSFAGPDSEARTSGRLEIESALRAADIVFENRSVIEGDIDTNVCPTDARCDYEHVSGLKRQSSRLVYDMPEQRIRFMAGDADPVTSGFQSSTELLGVSLQKSNRMFNPSESITATGSSSFRIERTSDVEVIINGTSMQHLHLRPGNYNVRDLPLATGANEITLAITDDSGEKRSLSFTTYFDTSLLATGQLEWTAAAGVPSYLRDNERHYANDIYTGMGNLRYGISDEITGEATLYADTNVTVAGLGFVARSPWGIYGLNGAGSWGPAAAGAALDVNWDLVNFAGLTGERSESLHIGAEFRSTNFHASSNYFDLDTGVLFPEYNYWLGLNASYSAPIFDDVTATLSARYRFDNEDHPVHSPYTVVGDRYGTDITLSRPLGYSANGSVTIGYSNETYLRGFSDTAERDPELRFAMRVSVRPDEASNVSAGYDSLNQMGSVSGYRSSGSGVGRWDTSVVAQHTGHEDAVNANAAVEYHGNRADVRVSHYSNIDGLSYRELDPEPGAQRTSLRVGTAIAFANSKIAFGAPIHGDAFAIVHPHESISGKEIRVGENETVRAQSDDWGPALVSDIPAFRPGTIPFDVDDLPLGYSLGAAAFDTFAPYRSGYDMEVGSSFSVSVYGTLIDASGAPLPLLSGTAHDEANPGRHVPIFTNAAGKFGAEGLAQGRWIIEMPGGAGTIRYVIDVPAGSQGLVKVGNVVPSQG
jgi:outer membrane usher protein